MGCRSHRHSVEEVEAAVELVGAEAEAVVVAEPEPEVFVMPRLGACCPGWADSD